MSMCLSKSQDDDSMSMCLSKSPDDDSISMCLSSSQVDVDDAPVQLTESNSLRDSMTMFLPNSQDDDSMSTAARCNAPQPRQDVTRRGATRCAECSESEAGRSADSMTMFLPNSQDDDSMSMSNSRRLFESR
jgi:hypothetical protein